ncbi:reverse transcriptase domain-containing protein [Paenibacillus terreus]|uniref:Reverse transcriptase domain-containing protein n=1 Tax=Paenibacillus terreus TaxID=1387834 RepID=A0ABV5B9G2_9BACL
MASSASRLLQQKFKVEYIKTKYFEKIAHRTTPGIDRINRASFEKRFDEYVNVISNKTLNGTYKLIPYKEKLISKGSGKIPRQISIPTIRDKITLYLLNEILSDIFENHVNKKIIQTMIYELKQSISSKKFDYFIKIDIKEFFPSISHDYLMKLVRKRIRKKEILSLIEMSLKTPTISYPTKVQEPNSKGVPQGISIASILANIYISEIDNKYASESNEFKYFRYVDDILVLCKSTNYMTIKEDIIKLLKNLNLETSPTKNKTGPISEGFSYLGYHYKNLGHCYGFSVREESIRKFEDSIIKIFSEYKFNKQQDTEKFIWRLNKKITGCIFEKKKYGWIFFYSQIDDLKLLYHFDWFIEKLSDQIEVDSNVRKRIKRFVRSYHEIIYNLKGSKYIPNFDDYNINEQRSLLREVFNIKGINNLTDLEVSKKFKKNVFRYIKELEKDVQNFS